MIQLANDKTTPLVRQMWERCFDDSPEFVDLYFNRKYSAGNTLIFFEGGEAVSSLQMLPYRFTFYGTEIDAAYISGACTLPEHRNRRYMEKLLIEAFRTMRKRNIPLSILIPAEDWLYGYYAKYGYVHVFRKDEALIPLGDIYAQAGEELKKAYAGFDAIYRQQDFCVQKTMDDFDVILRDYSLDNCPPKTNLSGMARVIDAEKLLNCLVAKQTDKSFSFSLKDSLLDNNSGIYTITNGVCGKNTCAANAAQALNEISICEFLFGIQRANLPEELIPSINKIRPVINLMLE